MFNEISRPEKSLNSTGRQHGGFAANFMHSIPQVIKKMTNRYILYTDGSIRVSSIQ